MKKLFPLLFLILGMYACGESNPESADDQEATTLKQEFFGDKITADDAIHVEDLQKAMGDQKELNVKVSGQVDAVCQKKGCWMELKNEKGENVRVTFKDYGFFVPIDCSGQTAIVDGIAKVEITSVQDLREYAKDEGKSQDEIDAITEPLEELVFEADGVIIQ